jgi:MFS family permease
MTIAREKTNLSGRWFVVTIFFFFMLLHQVDRLLIGPLTNNIMTTFNINYAQMGLVTTGALIVGTVLYPVWGWLYDRYSRAKLLSLAAFIWGSTTWLAAIAPTYPLFVVTRAATGIDDSSYPGLYSLVSDYFSPSARGKVYGLLQITSPLGYLIGMVMALFLGGAIGWRNIFIITGSLGVLMAIVMYFGLKEAPRGQTEPEMEGMSEITTHRFEWGKAKGLFQNRTMWMIYIQGFFGVVPWNVITYWFFVYLQRERGYSDSTVLMTMVPAVLIMAVGYPVGGALGDWLFKKNKRGRIIIATFGVIMGAILLYMTMIVPLGAQYETQFMITLCFAAFFIPWPASNVLSTIYDITLPEIRSTANAVESMIENFGAAFAPLIAGIVADAISLQYAIIYLCTGAWLICFATFFLSMYFIPKDIDKLRTFMTKRAQEERALPTTTPVA